MTKTAEPKILIIGLPKYEVKSWPPKIVLFILFLFISLFYLKKKWKRCLSTSRELVKQVMAHCIAERPITTKNAYKEIVVAWESTYDEKLSRKVI